MKKIFLITTALSLAIASYSSISSATDMPTKLNSSPIELKQGFFAYYKPANEASNIKALTGPYADIVVNLGNKGSLVLAAHNNYLPEWQFIENGTNYKQSFTHLVPALSQIKGRFDANNDFSYARILQQDTDKITIHWRYMPIPEADLQRTPTAFIHELITITADGQVSRLHRPGTDTQEQWQSLNDALLQEITLTESGLVTGVPQGAVSTEPPSSVTPSPLFANNVIGSPIAHWRFDEGQGSTIHDLHGSAHGQLDSHGNDWLPGVSGYALSFDGYRSEVRIGANILPQMQNEFTVEAWIYLAAYPWSDAPILQQINDDGIDLGVTGTGKLTLKLGDYSVTSQQPLPTQQWLHVSASMGNKLTLYVNAEMAAQSAKITPTNLSQSDIILGRNLDDYPALAGVREEEVDQFNHFSSVFGLEAVLDEIILHDRVLTTEEVKASYQKGSNILAQVETPKKRQLPDLESYPQRFGAYHTQLKFHDMWDNLWRVTDQEDIVVRFDNKPISLAYWRGTSHGMNLVTEGHWMSDQSVEMIIPDMEDPQNASIFNPIVTLAEHMSDKSALRTHVRLIENTPARIKIHWRYATADVMGTKLLDNGFVDEVHTIYPDGIVIRSVYYYGAENINDKERPGVVFYQDFQWLLGPGEKAEDLMYRNAVSLAELNGPKKDVFYPYEYLSDSDNEAIPEKGNIAVLNSKTNWKVFGISQGNTFYPASNAERSPYIDYEGQTFPFAGPWNHWPVAQIPSDGRYSITSDRVSHFALGVLEGFRYGTGSTMYGFMPSQKEGLGDPTQLQTLGKSWVTPATAIALKNVKNNQVNYDKNERAYHLTAAGNNIQMQLNANSESPLHNPAFVVHNWGGDTLPEVLINDVLLTDAKMSVVRDIDGSQMLILFLPLEANNQTNISIIKS